HKGCWPWPRWKPRGGTVNSTLGVGTVPFRGVRYRNRFARPLDRGTGAPTGGRQAKTNGHWWTPVQNILGDTAPLAESCIHKAVAERGLTPGHVGLADANAEDESATDTAFALRID